MTSLSQGQIEAAAAAIGQEFTNFISREVVAHEALFLDEYTEGEGATSERRMLAASRIHGAEWILSLLDKEAFALIAEEALKAAKATEA